MKTVRQLISEAGNRVLRLASNGRTSADEGAYVLIVDDEEHLRCIYSELLRHEGFAVAEAGNGHEALNHLRSLPLPSLILLDLMMPGMSGWEFRQQQRRDPRLASIPVAVLTGTYSRMPAATALDPVEFLTKPCDLDQLRKTVRRYCQPIASPRLGEQSSEDDGDTVEEAGGGAPYW